MDRCVGRVAPEPAVWAPTPTTQQSLGVCQAISNCLQEIYNRPLRRARSARAGRVGADAHFSAS